ncbi:hypothetical protein INR49_012396, partial [Caranx melampygus]
MCYSPILWTVRRKELLKPEGYHSTEMSLTYSCRSLLFTISSIVSLTVPAFSDETTARRNILHGLLEPECQCHHGKEGRKEGRKKDC